MDYLENPLMVYILYIYILEIIKPSLNPLRVYILYPLDTRKKTMVYSSGISLSFGATTQLWTTGGIAEGIPKI